MIATAGGRVPGRDLARSIGCSAAFLSQVVPPLVRAGWVTSRPGPDGGYLLAVAAGSVSVLDVIEAVEGPFDDAQCALRRGPCGRRPCALHEAWAHAREALRAAFGDVPVVAG